MSDENESAEGESESFSAGGRRKISSVLDNIQNRVGGGNLGEEMLQTQKFDGPIALPTDEQVVQEAIETMGRQRQQKIADEYDIEEEEDIKRIRVEIDVDEPVYLIHEFVNELTAVREGIIAEIKSRETDETTNPMTEEKDPIIPYIIKEDAGSSIEVDVLGGSRTVLYNMCSDLGLTDDEREFILMTHRISGKKNGLHRHLLVDDVLFMPHKQYNNPWERARDKSQTSVKELEAERQKQKQKLEA